MVRQLYIAYRKDRKHDAFIENVVDYLIKIKNVEESHSPQGPIMPMGFGPTGEA